MKFTIAAINCSVLLFLFTGLNCQLPASDYKPIRAVQIITPINHTFHLELDNLKGILEADAIKNRHVVILSISGSFRKGKSFLLNFFIRYLNAQYKKHDISDWMGENSNELTGFKWRGGRKPETTGIWMWPEIYIHDFENGEKVAIILLDTQGIFDNRSGAQDNAVTFALSMMLSSVQCYNVMSNIQEDDLNHLEFFTRYASYLYKKSNEKPFQNLLFIIRDWPYADEIGYGWNGQKVVDEVLSENDDQTEDMRELRKRIKSSFNEISAYLMPYPGRAVAESENFTGNLQQILPEFRNSIKELAPSLLAPENLVTKKINGQKIRARDVAPYLESYVNTFNGNTLPKITTVIEAMELVNNMILHNDSLDRYEFSMQNITNHVQSYFNSSELEAFHQLAKNDSLTQFEHQIGDEELISSFRQKLENSIEEKFQSFILANDHKRELIETANKFNNQLVDQLTSRFSSLMCDTVESANSFLSDSEFSSLYRSSLQNVLHDFDSKKMGNDEISNAKRAILLSNVSERRKRWKTRNDHKRSDYIASESLKGIFVSVLGGIIGGIVGGPPGAIVGATAFGAGSATMTAATSESYDKDANCY